VKIRKVGAESFLAGGRTDITELIVTSRNFANAPENSHVQQPAFVHPALPAYEAEVLPNWP